MVAVERRGHSSEIWRHLTAEKGARFTAAIERTAEQLPHNDEDGLFTMSQSRADALAALASVQISEDGDQDRATIMVHVDLETLRRGVGAVWTEEGALLSVETLEKLLCDSRLKALVEDNDGKPLGVGRTMRHAPRWMRHAAKVRDKTCCFPGCNQRLFLAPHHMKEWADLGPTDLDNLPLLCPFHHALVHKKEWRIEGSPSQGLVFIGPKGPRRTDPTRLRRQEVAVGGLVPAVGRGPIRLVLVARLLPLDGARRFRSDVVGNAVHTRDLVDDPIRDSFQ